LINKSKCGKSIIFKTHSDPLSEIVFFFFASDQVASSFNKSFIVNSYTVLSLQNNLQSNAPN